MFDLGIEELAVVAVVALVVIGPKDLPAAMRTAGQWVRKARLLAGEFHRTMDDMVREAELDDVRRQVEALNRTDLTRQLENSIDPRGELKGALDIRDPGTDAQAEQAGGLELPAPAQPAPPPAQPTAQAQPQTPPQQPQQLDLLGQPAQKPKQDPAP